MSGGKERQRPRQIPPDLRGLRPAAPGEADEENERKNKCGSHTPESATSTAPSGTPRGMAHDKSAGTFLGPYAYCELPPESLFLVFTGAALPAAGACTEGYLPPGGVLRLAAPGG